MHKEKRKTNPRRRVLIKLIFGLVLIVSSVAVGIQALRPTGAQIVYIAPDDNGYDAISLADVNDPENPRQLTHHEGKYIADLQVSAENSIIFYTLFDTYDANFAEFRIINLDTGNHEAIQVCETIACKDFQLHPNGQWLTFEDFSAPSNRIYAYNLITSEKYLVFDFGRAQLYSHFPKWVGDTNSLIFRIANDNDYDEFAFYDLEEQAIVDTITVDTSIALNFSHNGSLYAYYPIRLQHTLRSIRDINDPEISYQIPYPVYDWHPNNEELLMVDYFYNENNTENIFFTDIYLFDMLTSEYEILLSLENSSPQPTFNADGSQILYSAYVPNENYHQIMILDMESREEITLPIIGSSPQWVNGGR